MVDIGYWRHKMAVKGKWVPNDSRQTRENIGFWFIVDIDGIDGY